MRLPRWIAAAVPVDLLLFPGATADQAALHAYDTRANTGPVMSQDFPDPSILQDIDNGGSWYAFATSGNGKNVQVAKAPAPSGPWTYLDQDLLPNSGRWTTGQNTWAPDVRRIAKDRFVMYYSGQLANDTAHHCVGAATATSILGPYTPSDQPLSCHIDRGGSIDPAGFLDESTNRRFLLYKIDGNSIGHGGDCNNGVAPLVPTPIMLQEMSPTDGIMPIGQPVQILDRTEADGPLVEAPDVIRTSDGVYMLFYSNHCYSSSQYSVNYATASSVSGPYTRHGTPLIQSGDFGTTSPGSATSIVGGGALVFHANCPAGRCMYAANFTVVGTDVIIS